MRRVAVIVLILLAASTASAQWYMGLKLAGTADQGVLFDEWYCGYRGLLSGDNDGVIDNTQMVFGYALDAMDVELSLGYWKDNLSYDSEARYTEDTSYSQYVLGLTGLYHLTGSDNIAIDGGLRFQLESEKWDGESGETRYSWEDKLSGWAVGPVLRGRWFFADGALALGPEVFFKYSSKKYTEDYSSDRSDYEMDVTGMGFEYALRLDFLF